MSDMKTTLVTLMVFGVVGTIAGIVVGAML